MQVKWETANFLSKCLMVLLALIITAWLLPMIIIIIPIAFVIVIVEWITKRGVNE